MHPRCADAPAPENEILLAHIFRYEGEDLDQGIRKLAGARGAPGVFHAAENVSELRVGIGTVIVNPHNPPWGRGVIVLRVASRDAAVAWTASAAYTGFQKETAEDVIVLLQGGTV